jgi:hypothetical protein
MAGGIAVGLAAHVVAGTQDFTLVNKTGIVINNLYVSESASDSWEEDVLGDDVLDDGESVKITFRGRKACSWDLMVKDAEGEGLYWRNIDLCEVSKVTLRCKKKECYAEYE